LSNTTIISYGFSKNARELSFIIMDYKKCTGCRTCETVCSSFNNKVRFEGEEINGTGNPFYSNIKVFGYNPDVDIPVTCSRCIDAPCIAACPVEKEGKTEKKALSRNEKDFTVQFDETICIRCGLCVEACINGIVRQNNETGYPFGRCTLCDGEPQCVKFCPYEALSFEKREIPKSTEIKHPDEMAKELIRNWYF